MLGGSKMAATAILSFSMNDETPQLDHLPKIFLKVSTGTQ